MKEIETTETTETTEEIGMSQPTEVHWGDTDFGIGLGIGMMLFGFAAIILATSKLM